MTLKEEPAPKSIIIKLAFNFLSSFGHDYCVLSLSDRLKPWDAIARRLVAAASADLAIAIYNPASRSRGWQLEAARDLLLQHRSPDTPVVIGRDIGRDDERITTVRLAELDPSEVDMRCLLIVGSSTTRAVERGGDTTVYTVSLWTS